MSRFPEAIPLKSISASRVAEEMIKFVCQHGIPSSLLSDCGTNLTSKIVRQMCDSFGIKHVRAAPYHPQTNGVLERFHRCLKAMISAYITQEGKCDWDVQIPLALFAYHCAEQKSMGFSPFQLVYGYNVRMVLSILKEIWCGNKLGDAGQLQVSEMVQAV